MPCSNSTIGTSFFPSANNTVELYTMPSLPISSLFVGFTSVVTAKGPVGKLAWIPGTTNMKIEWSGVDDLIIHVDREAAMTRVSQISIFSPHFLTDISSVQQCLSTNHLHQCLVDKTILVPRELAMLIRWRYLELFQTCSTTLSGYHVRVSISPHHHPDLGNRIKKGHQIIWCLHQLDDWIHITLFHRGD